MKGSTIQRGIGAAAVVGLLAACGGGSETSAPSGRSMSAPAEARSASANQPPLLERVALEPRTPSPGADLQAHVGVSDPDGDAVTLRYTWLVDGRRVPETGARLRVPESTRKGVPIELEVVAGDGRAESAPLRTSARVGNRPPDLLGVLLEPGDGIKVGEDLVAVPDARDLDGDSLRFSYAWRVNGRPVPGEGERFSSVGLKRGDRVSVRVRVSDGEVETPPLESGTIPIGNSAPAITSTPGGVSGDGQLRYTVEASDPDGDRNLRFQLVQGPGGARIDPLLGELQWQASREQVGVHGFEVLVQDGHGGEARQRFEVTVAEVPATAGPTADDDELAASLE